MNWLEFFPKIIIAQLGALYHQLRIVVNHLPTNLGVTLNWLKQRSIAASSIIAPTDSLYNTRMARSRTAHSPSPVIASAPLSSLRAQRGNLAARGTGTHPLLIIYIYIDDAPPRPCERTPPSLRAHPLRHCERSEATSPPPSLRAQRSNLAAWGVYPERSRRVIASAPLRHCERSEATSRGGEFTLSAAEGSLRAHPHPSLRAHPHPSLRAQRSNLAAGWSPPFTLSAAEGSLRAPPSVIASAAKQPGGGGLPRPPHPSLRAQRSNLAAEWSPRSP